MGFGAPAIGSGGPAISSGARKTELGIPPFDGTNTQPGFFGEKHGGS